MSKDSHETVNLTSELERLRQLVAEAKDGEPNPLGDAGAAGGPEVRDELKKLLDNLTLVEKKQHEQKDQEKRQRRQQFEKMEQDRDRLQAQLARAEEELAQRRQGAISRSTEKAKLDAAGTGSSAHQERGVRFEEPDQASCNLLDGDFGALYEESAFPTLHPERKTGRGPKESDTQPKGRKDDDEDEEDGHHNQDPGTSDELPREFDLFARALSTAMSGRQRSAIKEHESSKLSETDPESWITFKDNFLTTTALNEWKDDRAKLKLKAAMRDEAARAVQHIRFSAHMTLKQALEEYETVFVHPAGIELAQAELERTKKKNDETLLAFHTRLRYLFIRAYPRENPELSKKLKDLFTTQLGSLALSKELRTSATYRSESYTNLLTRAQDVEATFKSLQDAYKGHKGIHAIQLFDNEPSGSMAPGDESFSAIHALTRGERGRGRGRGNLRRGGTRAEGPLRCYVCEAEGHRMRQCPFGRKALDIIGAAPHRFGYEKKGTKAPSTDSRPGGIHALHDNNTTAQPPAGNC